MHCSAMAWESHHKTREVPWFLWYWLVNQYQHKYQDQTKDEDQIITTQDQDQRPKS